MSHCGRSATARLAHHWINIFGKLRDVQNEFHLPTAGSASAKSVTLGTTCLASFRKWNQVDKWALSDSLCPKYPLIICQDLRYFSRTYVVFVNDAVGSLEERASWNDEFGGDSVDNRGQSIFLLQNRNRAVFNSWSNLDGENSFFIMSVITFADSLDVNVFILKNR